MAGYRLEAAPRERRTVVDALEVGARRHIVHALIELDVTRARQLIRAHEARTGETISFTAFIVRCLGRAVDAHKALHAYRDWRGRLVLFDEVDTVVMVEATVDHVAIPHVVRATNRKTVREIHDEIRRVQSAGTDGERRGGLADRLALIVPGFVRRLFLRALRKNPHWLKRASGTTIVTSVGMFGAGAGWAIAIAPLHTLSLTLGGILEKPCAFEGGIQLREILDVTVSVDHDVVDGAPAARFVRLLRELVEGADGLAELSSPSGGGA